MATISLCMIVKNEEEVLERCLNSVKDLVDEIIIVDTGSEDQTRDIALAYTDKLYSFVWVNDFSKARNYSFSKATCDYIMWLDADDIFSEKYKQNFIDLKENLDSDIVMMPYHVAFDYNDSPTLIYNRERIIKNTNTFIWKEPVHECITPSGKILHSFIPIIHGSKKRKEKDSERNLLIYRDLESQGGRFSPRALFYYARELKDHEMYCEAIYKYKDFLNSKGWIEDKINACVGLSECYLARNQIDDALSILFYSFIFDVPRPETCCRIANIYFDKEDYKKAACWYEQALTAKIPVDGFVYKDYIEFIPYIQLCVCYYHLGDIEKSIMYNDKAGKIKPDHSSFLANINFFKNYKKE